MATYKATDLVVTVDNRLQGWGVSVDRYDNTEQTWDTAYYSYMISESLREAVTDALVFAGIDWDTACDYADEWGIEYPDDEE